MKSISRSGCLRHGGALFLLAGAASAMADPIYGDAWEYEITPTAWATRSSGDLSPSSRIPSAVFSNGLKDTRLNAGTFSVEAGQGRFGLFLDVLGIELSNGIKQHDKDESKPNVNYNAGQLAAAIRLSNDPNTHFDLLAGVRYSTFDIDADKTKDHPCPRCGRTESWTDRIVGFRAEQRVGQSWWVTAYADYGKGASNESWQALLGATYRIDDDINAKFGYRVLRVDFQQADLVYNLKTSGVYAGVGMRF